MKNLGSLSGWLFIILFVVCLALFGLAKTFEGGSVEGAFAGMALIALSVVAGIGSGLSLAFFAGWSMAVRFKDPSEDEE